jgi:tetratricopeptide (TPR) repeat protein
MQSLGNGFEVNGTMTPQAKAYYEKAIAQFTAIKAKSKADQAWVHEDPATAKAYIGSIRMNLAQVMKKLGDYKAANTELAYILLATPSNVSVQIEAARTYSELGRLEKDSDKYLLAIGGARKMKSGDNLIWGWRKINRLTLGKDAFKNEYYESRLGIAEARLGYAMLKTGEDKKKYLGYAELEVLNTKKIYPDLGGPEFKARFDVLLKKIQEALAG